MHKNNLLFSLITIFILALAVGCSPVQVDLSGNSQENTSTGGNALSESAVLIDNSAGDLIPDGVLVSTGDESVLSLLDAKGQLISKIQTPGIGFADPASVIIAGALAEGQPLPTIVYRSWEPNQGLMANTDGQISSLRPSNYLHSMVGVPGQTAIAFSEIQINAENYPHTFLYSGTPENIGSIGSFYDLLDAPTFWALSPVGIRTASGNAQSVWYTQTAWGIGGADLIFPITKGLYLFDLTTGDNIQYLTDEQSFQGISPRLSYAGVIDIDTTASRAMSIINLSDLQKITFSLDPASDRGAGFAVFSPDDRFAAWLEAGGSMISDPYDFHPLVRVGEVQNGGVVAALDDAKAAQSINRSFITFMRPVGWLDNTTLLVEVRGENWSEVSLLSFEVKSSSLSVFASGSFSGFGYK